MNTEILYEFSHCLSIGQDLFNVVDDGHGITVKDYPHYTLTNDLIRGCTFETSYDLWYYYLFGRKFFPPHKIALIREIYGLWFNHSQGPLPVGTPKFFWLSKGSIVSDRIYYDGDEMEKLSAFEHGAGKAKLYLSPIKARRFRNLMLRNE